MEVAEPGEANMRERMRFSSGLSYSLGGTGLIASGGALTSASRLSEINQTRALNFGRLGMMGSFAAIATGLAIDVQRYRAGFISAEKLWERAIEHSLLTGISATGAWVGGGIVGSATLNPLAVGAGAMAGSALATSAAKYAGEKIVAERVQSERQRIDQAFGDAVNRRYGLSIQPVL